MNIWVFSSLLAAFLFSIFILIKKYLYSRGCKVNEILFIHFIVYGFLSLIVANYIYVNTHTPILSNNLKNYKNIMLITISSFFILAGVLAEQTALFKVNNPSYVSTILGVGVALIVYIASITLLKKKVELKGIIGIILSMFGLHLLTN